MKILAFGCVGALCLAACGPAAPTAATPPAAPTGTATQPQAAPAVSRLVGRWRATLEPAQERAVQLTRFALADPPDKAGFEAMGPNRKESDHFRDILRLRTEEPSSPMLSNIRRKLEQLDALRVTITEDSIITPTADGTDVTRYRVEKDLGEQLMIVEEGTGDPASRRWLITFNDDDHIVMTKGRAVMPMTRIGAERELDPPPTPRGPEPPSDIGAPRNKLGGELGRCLSTYYACFRSMPPEAQEAARPALELVEARAQQAADSPEDRASVTAACKDAVQLMRTAKMCD